MALTPVEEAKYALDHQVSRSGLSADAQTEYDRLVAEGNGIPTQKREYVPLELRGGIRHTVSTSGDHIFRSAQQGNIVAGVFIVLGGAGLIAVMIAMLQDGTITGNPWAPGNLAALTALILGVLAAMGVGVRLPFMRVRVRGQAVTITNPARTYRVNTADIARITVEQKSAGGDAAARWLPRAYMADGRQIWLAGINCGPASKDPDPKLVLILDELKALAGLST